MKLTHLLTLFTLILTLTQLTHSQMNMATCISPSQDQNFCLQCRDHYHLYEGLCFIDILGCDQYVYGNICRRCSNGYILVNNQCCDKNCMNKVYTGFQNSIENQENIEQAMKKAEIEGYEKSVSVLAKNSIKIGQDYEILSTKSQYFDNIYRYQVSIDIQGKKYVGILDYNIQTKQSSLVDLSLENQPVQPEINLNEENIHSNTIYERGYKHIYMKYGLDLYELSFSRMTALSYAKTTELKFVFVGPTKAVIMTIVVGAQEIYTLWKEQKTNVEEITQYVNNLKQIQTISKEQNFQSVFKEALTQKNLHLGDVQIVNITAVSKIQYIFTIYVKTIRIRYVIRGLYNPKTKIVQIKKMEEVFHPKLQDIKVPEKPETKIIEKSSISSSTQAIQVFDYLYKVRPSFRQTQVDAVKIETGSQIKTVTIMQTKDNKQYRVVILKDQKTNEFQLIDQSQVVIQTPKTTIIHAQNDGTTSVTTNHIDYSETHTKVVLSSLKQNNIDTTTHQISSIQTVEGPRSIEYTIVLGDLAGTPTKEVTIVQSKQTNITTLVDITNVDTQINYIAPVPHVSTPIPSTQFYKAEIKSLVASIQTSSEHSLNITKIKKIDVINTTLASKYELVVENQKGEEITITAIQDKHDQTVEVISVKQVETVIETRQHTEVTNTKKVDSYGVSIEFTNDRTILTSDQNVNIALTYINSQLTTYQNYEVVSSLSKTFTQNEQQTLILSNGVSQVQVTGTIDLKTLRYIHIEDKEIPLSTTYPVVHQNTIPSTIYTSYVKDHKEIKDSQTILVEKYKIFKGKVPTTTTIEQYSQVIKITFTYEIGTKKFIAVVDYNTTSKTGKVIQMNPVQENVIAVTVETKEVNGQTITTSNSVEQIKLVNSNTQTVLSAITTQYPLIKKYEVSTVKVIQSHISDTFEVSYVDKTTNLTTVITTTSDKTGQHVTISDINTKETATNQIISYTHTQVVQIAKEQYSSTNIQSIISFVGDTSVTVTNVTKITADIAPTFITYHLEVTSNDKSYNITVIEKDNKKEVVAVRTTSDVEIIRNIDLVSVDHSGNVIKETNNITQIKQSQTIQQSITNVVQTSTVLKNYDVKFVQTIDYGTTQQITITFEDSKNKQTLVQSVVFYDETTKTTNVVSVTSVATATYVHVSHPIIPTTVIPLVSIEQAIQTDKGLQTVISNIHTTQTTLATATTVSVEHQTLSKETTKYTVVLESNGEKSQAVYVWNSQTQIATAIVVATIPSKVDSYYITTTQTEEGLTIKSNNVQQITSQYSQVTNVLAYASTQQLISTSQNVQVNSITVVPSTQSITYTIDVTEHNEHKTVVFNQEVSTNTIKLIDFNVETVQTVYPREIQKVTIDISSNKQLVDQLIIIIKKTKGLQTVKQILSIKKQQKDSYVKFFVEVITTENLKYFVTLGGKTETTLTVLDVVQQIQTVSSDSGVQIQQVDTYGNTIIETTTTTHIQTDYTAQTSIQTVVKQNTHLEAFEVVSMRKVDYGTVEEIHFVFENKEQTKQQHVQSIVFYNKTSKVTEIASVSTISIEPTTYVYTPKPVVSNFIPGFAIQTLIQTNKGLQTVITNIHTTTTTATATTVSAESQTISENVVKYTVVLEQKGVKSQAVYLWNEQTKIATQIVVNAIATNVESVYVKKETTTEGTTIIETNNIKYISEAHVDFKDVSSFISTTTGAQITSTSTQIQLITQESMNTYTVTIKQEQVTKEITVNYDLKAQKTYLISYSEKPIEVQPIQVHYNHVEVNQQEKVQYLNWIKDLHHKDVPAPINILSIKSVKNALYSEAIIQVQTQQSTVFIKTIKTPDSEVPTVVSVTQSPTIHIESTSTTQSLSEQTLYISEQSTSTTTDSIGHIVTQSTSTTFINKSEVIQFAIKTVFAKYPKYADYTVKYTKTVRFTKAIETIFTLQRTSQDVTVQAVTVYDQSTKQTTIISVRQLPAADVSITTAPYPVPVISTVVIPQNLITSTIKSDVGLQTVITSSEIKTSTIVSAQIQTYDATISQYSIVVESTKGKQQIISIFNSSSNTAHTVTISTVATDIKPTVFTQTTINNQNIVISNQIDLIKQTYSEATTTINTFIQQNPTITPEQIESFIVTPSSQTTSISIIATNEQSTKYTYDQYITTDSKQTIKVDSHTIAVIDLVKPKPVVSIAVSYDQITSNTQITSQLIKIVHADTTTTLDTTKIISIQKSQQTNVHVYTINTLDSTNQQVAVQVIFNPITQVATVVDISKVVETQQVTFTETLVQEFTGKSSVVTTNTATIKQSKEFKKISDLIIKNHPTEASLITYPLLETTEKYQRAAIKTIVFSQESKTIQGTYLVDQRSNTVIELNYNAIESGVVDPTTLPVNILTITYTSTQSITSAVKQNIALVNTIKAVEKVDFSLANLVPIFIEIKNYTSSATITLVFQTPTSNSRVLAFYNYLTAEAKVVDYTKVPKNIEPSKTIESTNELGQVSVFTTNTKTITTTEQYKSVYSTALKVVPSLTGVQIKGVETVVKQNGKEYTILTVNNGIISQVVLQTNTKTSQVTFISHTQTSVANQIISVIPQPQQPTKIDIQTLQTHKYTQIAKTISTHTELNLGTATIVSGTVTSNDFVQTYSLVVKSQNNTSKVITVTKDLTTQEIIINNVESPEIIASVQIQTITSENEFGQIQTTTNDYQEIITSEETTTVIKKIIRKKPQLINSRPISTKFITYGNTVESTILFSNSFQPTSPFQITSIMNTKTSNVEIVATKQVTIEQSQTIASVSHIQTIPALAIKIAAKKSPEINQIITLIQQSTSKTTQIQQLKVQDFGAVKKYIAVVQVAEGVRQIIFFFDKQTETIQQIDSQTVAVVKASVFYSQTVNYEGQTVISSSSVSKIVQSVPETTTALNLLVNTYSQTFTSTIKSVESKGTTIKQIKFVSVDTTHQQHIHTVLVDTVHNTVKIIDVSHPIPSPKPLPSVQGGEQGTKPTEGEKGIRVTPAVQKNIEEVITKHVEIKEKFVHSTVQSVHQITASSFTNTYIATIKDQHNNVANVTLIQNPGESIQVVNIESHEQKTTVQVDVSTHTTTSTVTGQVKITTNDVKVIQSSQVVQQITNSLIKVEPQLIKYQPVSSQTVSYGEITQTTLSFTTQSTSIQTVTLYNQTSKSVQVVSINKVQRDTQSTISQLTVSIQTIPGAAILIASKKMPEIKQIITYVQAATTKTTQIETLTVQDYGTSKKYIAIAIISEGKHQSVYFYEKKTQTLKQISVQILSSQIAVINVEQTVTKWGQKVITSNNLQFISQKYTDTTLVVQAVDKVFNQQTTTLTQSVQITQQQKQDTQEYKLVIHVNNTDQQVTVTKQNNNIKVTNVEVISSEVVQTQEQQTVQIKHTVQTIDIKSEVASEITQFVQASTNTQISTAQIIAINATQSLISTIYEVTVKDSTGKVTVLEVLNQPGENFTLISTNEVHSTASTTLVVQQSITTKQVNQITGQTVTTSTDSHVIQSTENTLFIEQIVQNIPSFISIVPSVVQTVQYGNYVEKTFVLVKNQQTVQVTTLLNKTSSIISIVDTKKIASNPSVTIIEPVTYISVIPAALITATATQITQISDIVSQIKTTTKKEVTLESITIEDYGNVNKYIATLPTLTNKQQFVYHYNKKEQTLTLIDTFTTSLQVQNLVYEQSTNQFGQVTVQSNNAAQVVATIPQTSQGLTFIQNKYSSITSEKIDYIKVVEYPQFYQSTIVADSASSNSITIVLNVDKQTKVVTEVSTYSSTDVQITSIQQTTQVSEKPVVTLHPTDPLITKIIKFIESSKDIPINQIKTVTYGNSTKTVFGSQIITVQVISTDLKTLQVIVSYNHSTNEFKLVNFEIIKVSSVSIEAVTNFKVDSLTGTKTTTTNDTTVITSSQITTTLIKELHLSHAELATQTIISSTTVQYPDKVKVISVFSSETTSNQVTKITSIYDKSTASIRIVETEATTTQQILTQSTTQRQIYTSTQIKTAEIKIKSVPATTIFIQEELPAYVNQNPTSIIVEQMGTVDFISYIYESTAASTQVVVMYNKTSGESTLVESNPIEQNIQAFFYEEKKNIKGESVIISNNLTEVVQRVPKTEILQIYINKHHQINTSTIKTVESVIGTEYNYYTIVAEHHTEGLKQYEFVVNIEKKQVRQIENIKLPSVNDVAIAHPKPAIKVNPEDPTIKPFITTIVESSENNLNSVSSIVSVFKTQSSNVNKLEIEYVNQTNQVNKLIVHEINKKPVVIDERPIDPKWVDSAPIVVSEQIDSVTKTTSTTFVDAKTFSYDSKSTDIIKYVTKNIPETSTYTLESATKQTYGHIEQYDILYKSTDKAPLQISIANDNNNQNIIILETKKITEQEQKGVLESSVSIAKKVQVSEIEKENIKVLSKLGLVKNIQEYIEVALETIEQNQLFLTAIEAVKQSYSVLLKQAVIIKVLQKQSLQADTLKVFFKCKDQIYEADIQMNSITLQIKLISFIKIGTQSVTKSEVNVYSDLCYGYQSIQDISSDSNIDFLLDYLKKKYETLSGSSLTEAQSIVLENGRVNYKLYFKKDGQTIKYIVYYEPQYKRVLEVKGTSFLIGDNFKALPKEQQITDPYFRKLDTYIRQNNDQLNSAFVLHTESKDDGQTIQFRTVYSSAGKTFRSIATIHKDNQNVNENALNEIIEVPTSNGPTDIGQNDQALSITKLDMHDIGKDLYFTEAHRFIQSRYQSELDKAQLIGTSGKSSLFKYNYKQFYMIDNKIVTVSAEYNPNTQKTVIISEPQTVNIQQGYYAIGSDKKVTQVRNWLREKNLDLTSSVLVSSQSKQILFGTAYRLIFKDMTKYYTYVVYNDNSTNQMKIFYQNDSTDIEKKVQEAKNKANQIIEPIMKGFARPSTQKPASSQLK